MTSSIAIISVLLLVFAVPLFALAYTMWAISRLPEQHPGIASSGPGPRVLCVGASMTHGRLSADWVGGLRRALKGRATVVNAGVNGHTGFDVLRRIDALVGCEADLVFLLFGANNVMASLNAERAAWYVERNGLPEPPSLDGFERQLSRVVESFPDAVVAIATLPALGEHDDSAVGRSLAEHNRVIREVARATGARLVDLHGALRRVFPPKSDAPAFIEAVGPSTRFMLAGGAQRYLLGRSWDEIADRRGLRTTHDHVHLTDRAAVVVRDAVLALVEEELSLGEA